MTKLKLPISFIFLFHFFSVCHCLHAQNKYDLNIRVVDRDSAFLNTIGLQNSFSSQFTCTEYVNKLPSFLHSKGYVTASIDSLRYDSASAHLVLFFGESYHWAQLNTEHVDAS